MAGRQAGRLEVHADPFLAKAEIVNILRSLELFFLFFFYHALSTTGIHDQVHGAQFKSSVNSRTCHLQMRSGDG